MKRRKKSQSFLKGIIIIFSMVIVVEGLVLFGLPAIGIDVNDTISYVTETINAAKGFIIDVDSDSSQAKSTLKHMIEDGPMEGKGSFSDSNQLDSPVNTGEEYTFDSTTYPYRALLSESEQQVYNQIYSNALEYNTNTFN